MCIGILVAVVACVISVGVCISRSGEISRDANLGEGGSPKRGGDEVARVERDFSSRRGVLWV